MGELKKIVTKLHEATRRDYLERMLNDKKKCMKVSKQYGFDYWDGDRKYGYGGYRYIPGRWKTVAQSLINTYGLTSGSKVLDVGCGKGYLLYEMMKLVPGLIVTGFDISRYGLDNSKEEVKPFLYQSNAADRIGHEDNEFDLVISLGALHNLKLYELERSICEIERIGRQAYIMVESYRNEDELFNLQCWALTAETFFDQEEWVWLLNKYGYSGDYEFIFFE